MIALNEVVQWMPVRAKSSLKPIGIIHFDVIGLIAEKHAVAWVISVNGLLI